jgi:hypothetical protein
MSYARQMLGLGDGVEAPEHSALGDCLRALELLDAMAQGKGVCEHD